MGSRIYLASGRYVDVEPAPAVVMAQVSDLDVAPTWLGFHAVGETEPQVVVRVDRIETIVPLH